MQHEETITFNRSVSMGSHIYICVFIFPFTTVGTHSKKKIYKQNECITKYTKKTLNIITHILHTTDGVPVIQEINAEYRQLESPSGAFYLLITHLYWFTCLIRPHTCVSSTLRFDNFRECTVSLKPSVFPQSSTRLTFSLRSFFNCKHR